MYKRFLLAAGTMLVVLVLLLIYLGVTGESTESVNQDTAPPPLPIETGQEDRDRIEMLPAGAVEVGDTEKLVFESRDKLGRVIRQFGFERREPSGAGIFKITRPWVKIYGRDEHIIEITARTGSVPLASNMGQIELPQSGQLENVRIEMYSRREGEINRQKTAARADDPEKDVEMFVTLEGQVDFELEFSRLKGPGRFEAVSPLFTTNGQGLSLEYDQLSERLRELELRQIEKLELAAGSWGRGPIGKKQVGPEEKKASQDSVEKEKVTTYRFTMSDEVVIKQAGQELTADAIEILTDVDHSRKTFSDISSGDTKTTTREKATTKDTKSSASDTEQAIEITCKGPLRITVADDQEPSPQADRLEFKAQGAPAVIWREGAVAVQADQISYDQRGQTIELSAGKDRPVKIWLAPEQWASAQQKVYVNQQTGLAVLTGPGRVEYAARQGSQPSLIDYEGQMQIQFDVFAGEMDSAEVLWRQTRWVQFAGGLRAQNKNGQIEADNGKLTFVPVTADDAKASDGKEKRMRIESIELAGNMKAAGSDSGFGAQRMRATFAADKNGQAWLEKITAWGQVQAENPEYIIEANDKLQLEFAQAGKASAKERKTGWGFDQFLKRGSPVYALAEGADGKVCLRDKKQEYLIVGDRAEVDTGRNVWVVEGRPARVIGPGQESKLEVPKIIADLNEGLFEVPGAGNLNVLSRSDLAGQALSKPVPVYIAWREGAAYSLETEKIICRNVTAEIEQTGPSRQYTIMTCPRMTILLTKKTPAKTQQANGELSDKQLSLLIAEGPIVQINHIEYEPASDQAIIKLALQAQRLQFDYESQLLLADGSGWVDVTNLQGQSDERNSSAPGSLKNTVTTMLDSSGPSRTLIRFGREMRYNISDRRLSFTGGVKLDNLPLSEQYRISPEGVPQINGMRSLSCHKLDVVVDEENQPQKVHARGGVFFETQIRRQSHILVGEHISYDNRTNWLTARAGDSIPVLLDQMQFSHVRFNLITGDIDAAPVGPSVVAGGF